MIFTVSLSSSFPIAVTASVSDAVIKMKLEMRNALKPHSFLADLIDGEMENYSWLYSLQNFVLENGNLL